MSANAATIPFVVVIWDDAWGDTAEGAYPNDIHEKHMPTVMETRGWLGLSDEKGLSLFSERCLDKGETYYRGRSFIPKQLVKSITEVILSTPRKSRHAKNPPVPPEPASV